MLVAEANVVSEHHNRALFTYKLLRYHSSYVLRYFREESLRIAMTAASPIMVFEFLGKIGNRS